MKILLYSQRGFSWVVILLFCMVVKETAVAQDVIAKGDAFWAKRDTIENTKSAIVLWETAVQSRSTDIKLWTKIAVGYYWLGELTPENDKKARQEVLAKGLSAIGRALALDPENVSANYWAMVIQGRLTEAKGILSGFDFGSAIQRTLLIAHKDHSFHHGGVYRFWGRVIYYIPPKVGWFFKFDMEDSVKNYQKCIQFSPNFLESYLYLAETYLKMGNKQKAVETLTKMINIPAESLPEFAPENRFYQEKAKKLLASLK